MRIVLLISLLFVSAFQAVMGEVEGDWTYSVENNQATITGYVGGGGSVTIPSIVNGINVTRVGYQAFLNRTTVTTIIIPSSVTRIEDSAFKNCSNLLSVSISDSVTSIGPEAFRECIQLKHVNMSSNLTILGDSAFSGCRNLTNFTIPAQLSAIGGGVFEGTGLISLYIPDNIQSIGILAFAQCLSLEKVYLGNGVYSIGIGAFAHCLKLETAVVGQNVNVIRQDVIYNCSSLDTIYFLGNVPLELSYQTGYPETTKVYYNPAKFGWNSWWANGFAGGRSLLPFLPKIKSQGISIDQEIKKYSIAFDTVYGVRYDIETSSDLVNWSTIQTINGDGNENTFLTDMTDKAFFRIFQQ
jgi:hypothetical protein